MVADELVGGSGWISDESSFYGDDESVDRCEERARRQLELPQQASEPPKKQNVPTLIKSTPESGLGRDTHRVAKPRTGASEEASDLVRSEHFKGREDAWQQHDESIEQFLRRLPVADAATANAGPWLWVGCPENSRNRPSNIKSDPRGFIEIGQELIRAFVKQRSKVEAENAGKAPATITRKMGLYRDQLEEDLLSAAVKANTTCGKWMLFPSSADLPRYWRVVAKATSEGKLGPTSKVATYDPFNGKDETLICVYTYDFTAVEDVRRVLDQLVDLGLCRRDGKPIYYKCDAYTYMDIKSNNAYKLRASLFSSVELFNDGAKPSKEGPIARLKKRNQTFDSFLAS